MPRFLLVGALAALSLLGEDGIFESVVASLAYGSGCSSTVTLQNLSDRTVVVELEGHRESGALAPVVDAAGSIRLTPHARGEYRLDIDDEDDNSWIKVRERVPDNGMSPVIAVRASSECAAGNQLRSVARSVAREVVFPMRNPWFSGDVAEMPQNVVSVINTSESAVRVTGCYSSGSLYSVGGGELQPVCNDTIDAQIPAFGSRRYAVTRNGNTHFSLKVRGNGVVLEMLRPSVESRRIFAVDSSIKFGEEAAPAGK